MFSLHQLSILASNFNVEICAIDIQTCRPYFFGEGAGHALRCFLLYSGIHYDAVALSTNGGGNDESGDVTMFATDDDTAVARAVALANELRRVRYSTEHNRNSQSACGRYY